MRFQDEFCRLSFMWMINDTAEYLMAGNSGSPRTLHSLYSPSPGHINPDCNVELNSNYAVLIFHYTCPSWGWRARSAGEGERRKQRLNNWTIMESGMAKACFLSRRVRRAIVATIPPSPGTTLSSSPSLEHCTWPLRYRSHLADCTRFPQFESLHSTRESTNWMIKSSSTWKYYYYYRNRYL